MAERAYALGHSEDETQRLIRQGAENDLSLRRLLEDAGISAGMRVLDLGSGAGDVTLATAELVGGAGGVVGVDSNPAIVETARERARAGGHSNVSFVVGDLDRNLDLEGEFDGVVGRRVLTHLADPTATLRSVQRYLRPRGVVAFQENAGGLPSPDRWAFPPSPLWGQVVEWREQAFALGRQGRRRAMGWMLYQVFLDAGLTEPQMRAHAVVYTGRQGIESWLQQSTLPSLRPTLIGNGLAKEEEMDLDAVNEQLRKEFTAERKVAIWTMLFDAWARKP